MRAGVPHGNCIDTERVRRAQIGAKLRVKRLRLLAEYSEIVGLREWRIVKCKEGFDRLLRSLLTKKKRRSIKRALEIVGGGSQILSSQGEPLTSALSA